MFSITTFIDSLGKLFSKFTIWTRFAFLKTCGGLKVEGRISRVESGFVKLDFSAQRDVDAKERTTAARANAFILRE